MVSGPRRAPMGCAPQGDLAIFHTPLRHAPGLVKLGRLEREDDIAHLARPRRVRVEIAKVPPSSAPQCLSPEAR